MDDPELLSDETVLTKAQRLYVKSIPFEGILTSRQIILIDREKKLLPPKKIPLGNITETFCGEDKNADPTLTLSVLAKTGVTRQIVLTFQRLIRANPTRERDEWVKKIRRATMPPKAESARKAAPKPLTAQKKGGDAAVPGSGMAGAPGQQPQMPPKKSVSAASASGTAGLPAQPPVTAHTKKTLIAVPNESRVTMPVQPPVPPKAGSPVTSGSGGVSAPVLQTRMPPKKAVSPGSGSGTLSVPAQPPAPVPKKTANPQSGSGAANLPAQPPAPKRPATIIPGPESVTIPPAPAPKRTAGQQSGPGTTGVPAKAPGLVPGKTVIPKPSGSVGSGFLVQSTMTVPAQPPASRGKERIHPSRKIREDVMDATVIIPAPVKKRESALPPAALSCPKCNHKVPADSKFCDNCGSKIALSP
jgi:hypothetical protein